MQLVLHAPFGSRINKAWGLALRKRFCRQFNFELQAAATEDALMLSLGPAALVSAVGRLPLSAPRDDARRARAGVSRRARVQDAVAMEHDDLAGRAARARRAQGRAADPADAGGRPDGGRVSRRGRLPREHSRRSADSRSSARLPDRARLPRGGDGLRQGFAPCWAESIEASCGWLRATRRSRRSSRTRSSTPSRTRFSTMRLSRSGAATRCNPGGPPTPRRPADLGALDADAIARVREEERPDPRDADELHDAMLTAGFLTCGELEDIDPNLLAELTAARRAGSGAFGGPAADSRRLVVAVERLPELRAIHPDLVVPPSLQPPASRLAKIMDARRRDRRSPEGPADADRPGHGGGVGWSRRHFVRGCRRGAPAARSRRGGASRAFHAWRDRARMVRPDAPRPHSSLHAEPASRRDRAGQPGGFHALPLPLAARRDIVAG